MLVVGLTGGIGSGKSSFCAAFSSLCIPIIDADEVSQRLTQPNSNANALIAKSFGEIALLKDGNLNRAWLREIIFNDSTKKEILESILHPLILQALKKEIEDIDKSHTYCIVAIPLLFEHECFNALADVTIVIDCEEDTQIARVMKRNNLSKCQVNKIIATQMPRRRRNSLADYIVSNDGTIAELNAKVSQLHNFLLGKA